MEVRKNADPCAAELVVDRMFSYDVLNAKCSIWYSSSKNVTKIGQNPDRSMLGMPAPADPMLSRCATRVEEASSPVADTSTMALLHDSRHV